MSQYTTQLRWIIENKYDIGLKDYPIFDESYREMLNDKIINHYYFNEIGLETVALFVNRLNQKMNEIMPYYNQLYKTTVNEIEWDSPYSIIEEITRNGNAKGNSSATNTSDNTVNNTNTIKNTVSTDFISKFSDTPQGQITNDITNDNYLTNATVNKNSDSTNGTETLTGKNNFNGESKNEMKNEYHDGTKIKRNGNIGNTSKSELLQQYRKTFLNIDMMVIKDLSELFMLIW